MTSGRAVLLACAALLAAACGKFGGPKTYAEATTEATAAYAAGDYKKVNQLCERALALADKVGNGAQALSALECHADAASRFGKSALPSAYATVIDTYPKAVADTIGRYRLRNDYGVVLYNAGKEAEAIAALDAALTVYKGTPRGGSDTFWERMYIVRNLAKIYARKGPSAAATVFANEWVDEIETQIARSGKRYNMRLGAGSVLEILADLVSDSDPARALRLRDVAAEEREGEAQYRSDNPTGGKRCHQVTILGTQMERCFLELP